eukprot:11042469-Karenia_brevis.AAC.1
MARLARPFWDSPPLASCIYGAFHGQGIDDQDETELMSLIESSVHNSGQHGKVQRDIYALVCDRFHSSD